MLKVLQHVKYFHTTHGGMERVVEELVPALNAFPDLEVDVLCQGSDRREYVLPGRGRVFQARTDVTMSNAALSWQDLRIWQQIAPRYDLVHVHAPWPQSDINLLLSRYRGAVVVHWHRDIVRQRMLYAGYRMLERWLLGRADRICVTSPKLLAESTALAGFRHKAVAIPIGIGEAVRRIGRDDVEALRTRLRSAGYRDTTVENHHPHRKRIYFEDPEGSEWEFVEYFSEDPAERNDYQLAG